MSFNPKIYEYLDTLTADELNEIIARLMESALMEAMTSEEFEALVEKEVNKLYVITDAEDPTYDVVPHRTQHAIDGEDPITPEMIGAVPIGEDGKVSSTYLPDMDYATNEDFQSHVEDTSNPHGVTAAQIGAVNKAGDTMTGALKFFADKGSVGAEYSDTTTITYLRSIFGNESHILAITPFGPYYNIGTKTSMWGTNYPILHTGNSNMTRLVSADTTPSVNNEINWTYE